MEKFRDFENVRTRAIVAALLVIVALISIFPAANYFSAPETYAGTIESLDNKAETVTGLIAASAAVSTAITLVPDDAGTPIAEKLVDLSSDFAIVLMVIFLEKYLLTILGLLSFRLLIPVSLFLVIVMVLANKRFPVAEKLAFKLFLFGVFAAILVPASVWISSMIEEVYAADINSAINTAYSVSEDEEEAPEEETTEEEGEEESGGFFVWVKDLFDGAAALLTGVAEAVTEGLSSAVESAKNAFIGLIEAFAVLVVTSCVIPLLTLFFFVWFINVILGLNITLPERMRSSKAFGKKEHEA